MSHTGPHEGAGSDRSRQPGDDAAKPPEPDPRAGDRAQRGGSGDRGQGGYRARRDDRGDRGRRDDRAGGERGRRDDRGQGGYRAGRGGGGERGGRDDRTRGGYRPERGGRGPRPERDRRADREGEDRGGGPELPGDVELSALDGEVRRELRSLAKPVAEIVGKHLVAAGMLVDEDPERALEHARYARSRAARVAVVREAAGLAAYHAGEWAEALAELRAVRRMSGEAHLAIMADCERALGRPERAIELAAEAPADLPPETAVELRIVSAGARRDMGQLDAAVVALQGPDLDPRRREPWSARLFYAYADNLAAAGRAEDAIRWFLNAAEADDDEQTDAAERAVELGAELGGQEPPADE